MIYVVLPAITITLLIFSLISALSCIRKAVITGLVCFGLIIALSTEALSAFNGINKHTVALTYLVINIILAIYLVSDWRSNITIISTAIINCYKKIIIDRKVLYTIIIVALILLITLVTAVISPPNTDDSMTYHMARIMHWIQNMSVEHYPTVITRQLYSAPWAEFAIMHLQVLSGNDMFANLIQWVSMVGCILGVMLIAEELGASQYTQAMTTVIAATIPMAIVQSSSTQNDLAVSFWIVCFVLFGILFIKTPAWSHVILMGSSLGLAIFTKGTAYIFAFPFIVWLFCCGVRLYRKQCILPIVIIFAIVLGLNSGHYYRNYKLWGNPLTTDTEVLTNEIHNASALFSNIVRNIGSQIVTPFDAINSFTYNNIVWIHELFNIDINDINSTLYGYFEIYPFNTNEIYTQSTLHIFLIIIASIIIFQSKHKTNVKTYTGVLLIGFIALCFCLKWQVYGSNRFQMTLFILWAPVVAISLSGLKSMWTINIIMILLLICSFPWIFMNESRPFFGEHSIFTESRESLYFINRPKLYPYNLKAASSIGNCEAIALISDSWNAYEYPFWVLVRARNQRMPRFEYVNVNNVSSSIAIPRFEPCATMILLHDN
jgi:hypothetical protein